MKESMIETGKQQTATLVLAPAQLSESHKRSG